MPIFEFACECGEKFERIRNIPVEEAECPRCGRQAKRAVSVFSGSSAGGACLAPSGSRFS